MFVGASLCFGLEHVLNLLSNCLVPIDMESQDVKLNKRLDFAEKPSQQNKVYLLFISGDGLVLLQDTVPNRRLHQIVGLDLVQIESPLILSMVHERFLFLQL